MSLNEWQRALALVIRLPEAHRGERAHAFLQGFDLDFRERAQLLALTDDPKVTKYGRIMAAVRWGSVFHELSSIARHVPETILRQIWERDFEPSHTKLRHDDLALAFVDFLVQEDALRLALGETSPDFVLDLLRFERARLSFRPSARWPLPPPGSLLSHGRFLLGAFDYDVLEHVAVAERPPQARPINVLFVSRTDSPAGCLFFEIETPVQEFLTRQARVPVRPPAVLPDFYTSLVDIGLCRKETP